MNDCSMKFTRRSALLTAAGFGLSVTFLGRGAFAASESEQAKRKLIVIVCRGAMDGLSVSPPVGDPEYVGLRGDIAIPGFGEPGGALKLNDTFGLHPKLVTVHRLALAGQARIAPAIATTDRARPLLTKYVSSARASDEVTPTSSKHFVRLSPITRQ